MTVTIRWDDREVLEALRGAARRCEDIGPLLWNIGETIKLSTKINFETGGRPERWKQSKRAAAQGGITLSDTGRLRNSITSLVSGRVVTIGTNVDYAAAHQFGTKGHIIRPKAKKALNIPGIGLRMWARHPGLPARPFLMVQEQDKVVILRQIESYILEGKR
ncbi:MAG: virion morphogenesis protein [Desulfobulbus sp.]|jgi:phage gpG-like protein|nr:MAG: virion morphogenesis protein [Desulfobulbus sp.]